MAVGCSYFPLLGLGWPTFAAICLPVITRVFLRPSQEFRWGCYPNRCLTYVGWALWHGDDIQHLSKELYSLKQGSGENVAKFKVHLSQQVQILQLVYPGRTQKEHVEEMKWDHFYGGLNPKYWHMLAHKMDSEHPTSYSDLLLAAQKLAR